MAPGPAAASPRARTFSARDRRSPPRTFRGACWLSCPCSACLSALITYQRLPAFDAGNVEVASVAPPTLSREIEGLQEGWPYAGGMVFAGRSALLGARL